ncbi:MAG: DUF3592 domain-containing protein [Bacilli bacterium]|nr:DUF3592 domain-containing protein [Bacilli bacterium]
MNDVFTFFRETGTGRFFTILGIILLVFSFFLYVGVNNTKNYIKTEAIVSKTELYEDAYYDGDTHYDATYTVYVKYTVDGQEYNEEYGVFSGYKEGDKVTISYNPSNPSEIAQPNGFALPIVFFIVGVISLAGGVISIVKAVKKQKMLKEQEKGWANGN